MTRSALETESRLMSGLPLGCGLDAYINPGPPSIRWRAPEVRHGRYATGNTTPIANERRYMKIRPLQDRILVKRVDEEETTSGGIIIPDSAKEKPQEGQVVAVGPGKTLDSGAVAEPNVKAGDRILFSKYAGTDVNVDGEEHIIIREDDVLAIYE